MPDKPSLWSYLGAFISVFTGLTLTEWGVIFGILTALLTFMVNTWFQHSRARREERVQQRRDKREQLIHELTIERLRRGDHGHP